MQRQQQSSTFHGLSSFWLKGNIHIMSGFEPLNRILQVYHQDSLLSIIFQTRDLSRTTRLATFPNYLVLHMRKFVFAAGWVPKKLDVFVDVPDEIDISNLRSSGLKPDEQLLPKTPDENPKQAGSTPDQAIVSQLADMGSPRVWCEKAALQTLNSGLEEAMNWLLPHVDDPDLDEPGIRTGSSRASGAAPVHENDLDTLVPFEFPSEMTLKVSAATGRDTKKLAEWIWIHPEESIAMEVDVRMGNDRGSQQEVNVANVSGRYQLLALVSHMGTSTQSGHYVAHVRKNNRLLCWVIFNDCKVSLSGDPPKDKGYLYFFQRIPS